MTLAALIIIDDDRPAVPVLGLAWPEFQMRRAVMAGARHLVVVAGRVSRDLVEGIDRLRAEGLSATLVRNAGEVPDLFHPDEAVLLMTGRSIVGEDTLRDLLSTAKPTVLCVAPERATPDHELIDAKHYWTGLARIDGALVRATAIASGEWDLGSVLLRRAVAARAVRATLPGAALLAGAETTTASGLSARGLLESATTVSRGWGERWLLDPAARMLGQLAPASLPWIARIGPWAALTALVLAPVAAAMRFDALGIALFVVALFVMAGVRIATQTTGIPLAAAQFLAPVRDAAAVATFALAAGHGTHAVAASVLALTVAAFVALSDRLLDADPGTLPPWLADRAGQAVLLLIGSVFGAAGLLVALASAALHGLATLAWLQDRLSRVLTSLR